MTGIDWVPVEEDYPQSRKGQDNVSVDVRVKTKDGRVLEALYGFKQDQWYDAQRVRPIRDIIVAWSSL